MNPLPATGARKAALAFIFITVLIDVLAFGVIIPVLPHLVQQFVGGDTSTAAYWTGAFAFSFSSNLSPARSIFAAQAHGDLDGDGLVSTFEVKGSAMPGTPALVEPGLYVEAEFE